MPENMMNPAPKEWQFTGKHMLLIMVAFFGVIIFVNFTMAFFASKSWTGLVVKNSYVASQNFNRNVDAQNALLTQGWTGELDIKGQAYSYTLKKKNKKITHCQILGHAQRPVNDKDDIDLSFVSLPAGHYRVTQQLQSGRWVITVSARCPENKTAFLQKFSITVAP